MERHLKAFYIDQNGMRECEDALAAIQTCADHWECSCTQMQNSIWNEIDRKGFRVSFIDDATYLFTFNKGDN